MLSPLECLEQGIRSKWSGCIEAKMAGEAVGQIALSRGHVVWATFRDQSESLGVFLWRLGRLSRSQLTQITSIFHQHRGRKKLEAILEESGYMSRPVLRRCLLLHIRSALEGLLQVDSTATMMAGSPMSEVFLFSPLEVLPVRAVPHLQNLATELGDRSVKKKWSTLNKNNQVLRPLTHVAGYIACGVFAADGDLVVAHDRGSRLDITGLGVVAAAMLDGAARAAKFLSLDSLKVLSTCYESGMLSVANLDSDGKYFVCVFLEGNPDLRRHADQLGEIVPALRDNLFPLVTTRARRPTGPPLAALPRASLESTS